MNNENIYLSELDRKRFGLNVVKASGHFTKSELDLFSESHKAELVIARIASNKYSLLNALIKDNFFIADQQIKLSKELDHLKEFSNADKLIVREATIQDLDSLQEITTQSFSDYGHYSRNSKLNKNDCLDVYIDWIENEVKSISQQKKVFLTEIEGEITGYLSLNRIPSELSSQGGIGAIKTSFRSRGHFRALLSHSLNWSKVHGDLSQSHCVLLENQRVQRSMIALGFYPSEYFTTLHKWC